jgi:hypothetical protein
MKLDREKEKDRHKNKSGTRFEKDTNLGVNNYNQ